MYILPLGVITINKFGVVVKKFLIDNNLNQKIISDKLHITKSAVSQLLNRDNLSLDKMLMIADALDCDLDINLVTRPDKSDK